MGCTSSKPKAHSGGHTVLSGVDEPQRSNVRDKRATSTAGGVVSKPPTDPKPTPHKVPKGGDNTSRSKISGGSNTLGGGPSTPSSGGVQKHTRNKSRGQTLPITTHSSGPSKVIVTRRDTLGSPTTPTSTPQPVGSAANARDAMLAAAERRQQEERARGTNKNNPNQGRLASQLQAERTSPRKQDTSSDEPSLRWD